MRQEYFLKVIGSGDAFHHGKKLHTAFLYQTPEHNFLIDCGTTTLFGFQMNKISTHDIDTIIITHLHGDHFAGLPFLLLDMHKIKKRDKELNIIMPAGGKEKLQQLFTLLYPGAEDTLIELDINYFTFNENPVINGFDINAEPVLHTPHLECFGISITGHHKKLSYSGDTEWTDNLIKLAEDADLFICECNFYDQQKQGHLNYDQLMNNRAKLNCKKLLLTHLGETMLAQTHLALSVAEDGNIYQI